MSNAGVPINKSTDCKLQNQSQSGRLGDRIAALSLLAAHSMNFDTARDQQHFRAHGGSDHANRQPQLYVSLSPASLAFITCTRCQVAALQQSSSFH